MVAIYKRNCDTEKEYNPLSLQHTLKIR